MIIGPRPFNLEIIHALGLTDRKIRKLTLTLAVDELPTLYLEEFIKGDEGATGRLADVLSKYQLVRIPLAPPSTIERIVGMPPGRVREPWCEAVQHSDGMTCIRCGITWDMNDPAPPACAGSTSRGDWPLKSSEPPSRRVCEPSILTHALHFAASMVERARGVWVKVREKVKRG